jgi:hypothetical protein
MDLRRRQDAPRHLERHAQLMSGVEDLCGTFLSIGPNGLKVEKETTHDLV